MALAHKLAKVMGGRILVESQPGVGSTFTLEVPLRRPPRHPKASVAPADLGPAVLAVEDDPIGITVLRHVLQRRLKNVDCVASGREALEAAGRRHYDLILMDLQMPDINGLGGGRENPPDERLRKTFRFSRSPPVARIR